ncbi:MAG: metallophosphoesterase [Cyanobacteria bacterium P01_H01_bin.150]
MHWLLTGPLSLEKLVVNIEGLPASTKGTRIVQLSDLHYDGFRLSEEMLEQAIITSNEAEPDLVVITGDFITNDPAPIYKLVKRLKNLQSRVGIYAVLGNHDIWYHTAQAEVTAALKSIDIKVLWNEIAYPLGKDLPLVGLAEYWSKGFNPASVMNHLDNKLPRIVLSHNPDTAQILQQWRVDLQLSGHSHGGQIVLPEIGPLIVYYKEFIRRVPREIREFIPFLRPDYVKVLQHWEWAQGFHQVGKNHLYVNRGLGTYFPGRLFCPPEVTLITLE